MLGGTLLLPPAVLPSICRLLFECLAAGCHSYLSATQHPEARSSLIQKNSHHAAHSSCAGRVPGVRARS